MKLVIAAAHAVTVVVGGWLAADTLDTIASSRLRASSGARDARPAATAAPRDGTATLSAIRDRNVFFHGEPVPDDDVAGVPIAIPPGACTLPIEVTGAVLVRVTPELSLAALRDSASGRIDVFQIGDEVAPHATLESVLTNDDGGLDGVEVAFSDGHRERCGAAPGANVSMARPPPAGLAAPAAGRAVVSSADVAKLYADGFTSIASAMRALPTDGGWKLSGVPADSVLAAAGIRNGDVVKRVNGYEVKTAQDALSLIGILRNERDLTVDLTREGKPTTLEVAIR